jgi:hypothetical protein
VTGRPVAGGVLRSFISATPFCVTAHESFGYVSRVVALIKLREKSIIEGGEKIHGKTHAGNLPVLAILRDCSLMKIAQAILAKPHHRETAPEIFAAAEKNEESRKAYWAREKSKKTARENLQSREG